MKNENDQWNRPPDQVPQENWHKQVKVPQENWQKYTKVPQENWQNIWKFVQKSVTLQR